MRREGQQGILRRRRWSERAQVPHRPELLEDHGGRARGVREGLEADRAERFHDVTWHHSHVVIDPDGVVHTFCVYSAPDEARIREHTVAFGGHSIDWISVIADEVDPDEIAV